MKQETTKVTTTNSSASKDDDDEDIDDVDATQEETESSWSSTAMVATTTEEKEATTNEQQTLLLTTASSSSSPSASPPSSPMIIALRDGAATTTGNMNTATMTTLEKSFIPGATRPGAAAIPASSSSLRASPPPLSSSSSPSSPWQTTCETALEPPTTATTRTVGNSARVLEKSFGITEKQIFVWPRQPLMTIRHEDDDDDDDKNENHLAFSPPQEATTRTDASANANTATAATAITQTNSKNEPPTWPEAGMAHSVPGAHRIQGRRGRGWNRHRDVEEEEEESSSSSLSLFDQSTSPNIGMNDDSVLNHRTPSSEQTAQGEAAVTAELVDTEAENRKWREEVEWEVQQSLVRELAERERNAPVAEVVSYQRFSPRVQRLSILCVVLVIVAIVLGIALPRVLDSEEAQLSGQHCIFLSEEGADNAEVTYSDGNYDTVENPDPDTVNSSPNVLKYERNGAELYDHINFDILPNCSITNPADFEAKGLCMDIRTAAEGTNISLNVRNSAKEEQHASGDWRIGTHSQYKASVPDGADKSWKQIRFQLNSHPDKNETQADRLALYLGHKTQLNDTFYIDNFGFCS